MTLREAATHEVARLRLGLLAVKFRMRRTRIYFSRFGDS